MRCKCCDVEFKASRFVKKVDGSEEDLCVKCKMVVRCRNGLDFKWYQFEGSETGLTEYKLMEE